jgi:hypothetical protein
MTTEAIEEINLLIIWLESYTITMSINLCLNPFDFCTKVITLQHLNQEHFKTVLIII